MCQSITYVCEMLTFHLGLELSSLLASRYFNDKYEYLFCNFANQNEN